MTFNAFTKGVKQLNDKGSFRICSQAEPEINLGQRRIGIDLFKEGRSVLAGYPHDTGKAEATVIIHLAKPVITLNRTGLIVLYS